jgi:phage terminase large subunit
MPFEVTTAVKKMHRMTARKKVIQGATSSGKTYGIIPLIYDQMIARDNIKVTVVAETLPAVKEGALDIFKNFMYNEGRWDENCWNASTLTYTRPNRSKIQFKSFDSEGKAKASGKRDILFLNEANHIPFLIADALMIRSKEVWMDFNADSSFWAHTEVLQEHNSEFLKLTYLDNEAIPEETLEDLLIKKSKADAEDARGQRGYWWNWWQVYGLGEIGSLQGVVFDNWKQCDSIPQQARLLGYGCDFGYSNDPSTLVAVYQLNNEFYYDELIYQKGLLNSDLARLIKQHPTAMIYADSAEPKSIQELKNYGIRITATEKGADSIMHGISKMQQSPFYVTKRSLNLIKELRAYTWATDKTGATLNKPIDAFNHGVDAIRYYHLGQGKYSGKYVSTTV